MFTVERTKNVRITGTHGSLQGGRTQNNNLRRILSGGYELYGNQQLFTLEMSRAENGMERVVSSRRGDQMREGDKEMRGKEYEREERRGEGEAAQDEA